MGGVPSIASRHNTPSRSHALTSLAQREIKDGEKVCIIVSVKLSSVRYGGVKDALGPASIQRLSSFGG